jgi:hypothetical protein
MSPSPRLRTKPYPVSEVLGFLVFRMPDHRQSTKAVLYTIARTLYDLLDVEVSLSLAAVPNRLINVIYFKKVLF